jgi:hypothetical protein
VELDAELGRAAHKPRNFAVEPAQHFAAGTPRGAALSCGGIVASVAEFSVAVSGVDKRVEQNVEQQARLILDGTSVGVARQPSARLHVEPALEFAAAADGPRLADIYFAARSGSYFRRAGLKRFGL